MSTRRMRVCECGVAQGRRALAWPGGYWFSGGACKSFLSVFCASAQALVTCLLMIAFFVVVVGEGQCHDGRFCCVCFVC